MADLEAPLVPRKKCPENRKMSFHRRVLIGLAVVLLTVLSLSAYIMTKAPILNQYQLLRHYRTEAWPDRPRTILLWNDFFGDKRWSLPEDTLGPDYFRKNLQCPEYRCEVTNAPEFLPDVNMFDAILFHSAQPFPLMQPVPETRAERQLYVFALMEPPSETKHVLGDERNFYNLTMSYRLDSDIVWPYHFLEDVQTGIVVAPLQHPQWRQPPMQWNDTAVWSLWAGKTKSVAWFVSHCRTLSQREKLAAALQKYVDVDIFGKCGNESCPRGSNACDLMLDEKYKFYLSFENALCTDYVSEKFYNALQRQIVPIVFGGANYTRFAPPHSYIDAESFETVADLAKYLKHLEDNPAEYMRYFWWREYYRITYRSPFCDLCEKLHSTTYRLKSQTYRDIEAWWMGWVCRFEANIKWN